MKLVKELERLTDRYVDPSNFPMKKDGTIHVKNFVVAPTGSGYRVADVNGKTFSQVELLVSAIAIASNLAKGKNVVREVKKLDHDLSKLYSDSIFYEHAINTAKTTMDADIRVVRLEKAVYQAKEVRRQLNRIIYRSLKINTQNSHRNRKL